jgi:hypothetical protein
MREVVTRRYKRLQEEKKKMPSLIPSTALDKTLQRKH